jgi:hypothetical protein
MESSAVNMLAEADMAILELHDCINNGPTLQIVHRFHDRELGAACQPGEEVVAVFLLCRNRKIMLPLSLSTRLLVNYLAEWRHIPQSATQIAAGMRGSAFYRKHAANAGITIRRTMSRTAIKEYVRRVKTSLNVALVGASLPIDSDRLLVSSKTTGNEVLHQLRTRIEWLHLN